MAEPNAIRVEGLRELRSALRSVDKALPKNLQVENKAFAQEVAGVVRGVYQGQHPAQSGRGAASIRGLASQSSASIALGSARAPYMLGQEFGANQRASLGGRRYGVAGGRARSIKKSSMRQFPRYVPSDSGRGGRGYFMYPTLRARLPRLQQRYLEAIDRAFDRMVG